jgi:hypothetical protein
MLAECKNCGELHPSALMLRGGAFVCANCVASARGRPPKRCPVAAAWPRLMAIMSMDGATRARRSICVSIVTGSNMRRTHRAHVAAKAQGSRTMGSGHEARHANVARLHRD